MQQRRFFIPFVLLIFLVFVLYYAHPMFCKSSDCYYSGIIGSVLAAVFAAFLVWVAWSQLGRLSDTSSADFIYKMNTIFFTPETRTLITLIDRGALEYRSPFNDGKNPDDDIKPQPYFEVIEKKLNETHLPIELRQHLIKNKYYSTWQIDDLLLGHFEDIGRLEQRGIVDFQMVYDVFSWYIEVTWKSNQIKDYIRYTREDQENDPIDTLFYNQFQYIAIKCLEYKGLHSRPCKWWWKIKRYFSRPKIERNI